MESCTSQFERAAIRARSERSLPSAKKLRTQLYSSPRWWLTIPVPTGKVKLLRGKTGRLALFKVANVSLAGLSSPTFEIVLYESLCRQCNEMNHHSGCVCLECIGHSVFVVDVSNQLWNVRPPLSFEIFQVYLELLRSTQQLSTSSQGSQNKPSTGGSRNIRTASNYVADTRSILTDVMSFAVLVASDNRSSRVRLCMLGRSQRPRTYTALTH